eukprot:CAMPEP_0183360646 /NCGR_PEP_ID=MMETSP0164_2-20130417/55815_1 /TAXON_ID=221442 /ORGANISM="Coccolithus pelagicus ssp braarudi, Strain PLY182g" /LENGTH=325 /DNA_ID=CAMNT_0025535061 /DNA_START=105 /DNA_END=1082 /DNA_ORIENTATION=+
MDTTAPTATLQWMEENVPVSMTAEVLPFGEVTKRCGAGSATVVHGTGRIGIGRGAGYPSHFSHLLRNWLPRFWACKDDVARAGCSTIFVPSRLHALYQQVIYEFAPKWKLVGEMETAKRNGGLNVTCTHHEMLADYYKRYQHHWVSGCVSADVVFVLRTRPVADSARDPGQASGSERRYISNPQEVWQHVERASREANLTVEQVVFEQLSFRDQMRKTCTARMVVGQHGAGLGHILWSSSSRRAVLELPPWLEHWWDHMFNTNHIAHFWSGEGHFIGRDSTNNTFAKVNAVQLGEDLRRALHALGLSQKQDASLPKASGSGHRML